ncbi:MAG TPA: glycosyltransferase [Candidatus Binatia bacterium]
MKFAIINTDYPGFLAWHYNRRPELTHESYEAQMRARQESLFGVADFYSRNLSLLGHEALDFYANNELMQRAWAGERGTSGELPPGSAQRLQRISGGVKRAAFQPPLGHLKRLLAPLLPYQGSLEPWLCEVLEAQVRFYKPDVLLNQAMESVRGRILQRLKSHAGLVVGQIASPLPKGEDFTTYDLILSSLPNLVDHFRTLGVAAELHRFGFEPRVLDVVQEPERKIPVSFVGGLSRHHLTRGRLLEAVAGSSDIKVWGYGAEDLPADSMVKSRYQGVAWGEAMYGILSESKLTLNQHIDLAGNFANNMRMFEATGAGALLITDWKVNLEEMFEPGKEVLAYRNPQECVELIQYYLRHDDERAALARAGQERTLREHTYQRRMEELTDIVERYL